MKYLFFLVLFLSCENVQKKLTTKQTNTDIIAQVTIKHHSNFVDVHDPFATGKDTVQLKKAMDKITRFPEVAYINEQIIKSSKGKRGVAFFVHDEFNGDTLYYHFEVGDNSHEDRYVNIYNFLLEKKTGQIKAYDPLSDSILNLQDWRKKQK